MLPIIIKKKLKNFKLISLIPGKFLLKRANAPFSLLLLEAVFSFYTKFIQLKLQITAFFS